ncbi:Ohr family peroxiredoxin [Derxia gummosa]|uniref:Ohr family peroxiredoxin n=1 Tax=Derxia gummosa DSM 723 TaxID=1121388 RepID=A0A8B6X1V8_9BURK|nr:Ohr family peroxiredoxin [Derxia gummosa]
MDVVYKTTMLTQGGRGGQIQSEDGSFKLKLSVPKEMGGKGEGPNPEMLFAGAFAACFEHSVRHIAKLDKLPLRGSYVEAEMSMYVTFEGQYKIALTLTVHMAASFDQNTADSLLERAKGICPYSDATKGNMTLNLKAVLDTPPAA